MARKLYVGNIPYTTTESDLRDLFAPHGSLASVRVISDRETGRSRGFGFVEFEDESSANAARDALDGTDLDGRSIRVSEANERPDRGSRRQ
ncbi:MAG: RNA recognition motif domain-containing protein [Myxococcota bacterium]